MYQDKKTRHNRSKNRTDSKAATTAYNGAQALGINLSQTCERSLRETIRAGQERRWAQQHAEFILAYNRATELDGLPFENWRHF